MGHEIGEPFPILYPLLWYRCHVDVYAMPLIPFTCSGDYVGRGSCCLPGWLVGNWIVNDLDCIGGQLCPAIPFAHQRLVDITSVWLDFPSCIAGG